MPWGPQKSNVRPDKVKSEELKRAIEKLASMPELIERRHTQRPIPTGDAVESDDPAVWAEFEHSTLPMPLMEVPSESELPRSSKNEKDAQR